MKKIIKCKSLKPTVHEWTDIYGDDGTRGVAVAVPGHGLFACLVVPDREAGLSFAEWYQMQLEVNKKLSDTGLVLVLNPRPGAGFDKTADIVEEAVVHRVGHELGRKIVEDLRASLCRKLSELYCDLVEKHGLTELPDSFAMERAHRALRRERARQKRAKRLAAVPNQSTPAAEKPAT